MKAGLLALLAASPWPSFSGCSTARLSALDTERSIRSSPWRTVVSAGGARRAGREVREYALSEQAIVITSSQSGGVRFYSGRRTIVRDGLDGAWLDRAIDCVRSRGLEPFLLLERWEEPIFHRRFAASAYGSLDWPPMAEVASVVRIYGPRDRQRHLSGRQPPTEYAR
jgi:hypothetical protein